MKVGILGGSFNPPHQGHIHISNLALKHLALNQVWWIPTAHNPLKDIAYDSYKNRVKKCHKITSQNPKLKIYQSEEIHSFKLLQNLQAKFPHIEFFWIMGADNLENLHRWKDYKKFISLANLAIFSRGNSLIKIQKTAAWKFVKAARHKIFLSKNLDISSTKIREKTYE